MGVRCLTTKCTMSKIYPRVIRWDTFN
jgi:hypothetical protein